MARVCNLTRTASQAKNRVITVRNVVNKMASIVLVIMKCNKKVRQFEK